MKLDFIDPLRKTIDWLIEKYQLATKLSDKKKLKNIALQISNVASNNAIFIDVLKKALASEEGTIDTFTINSCIKNAEVDIKNLNEIITESELGILTYNFAFHHGLTELTRLKQIKISELHAKLSDNQTIENTIAELESFRLQWLELGNRIDIILHEKN